MGHATSHLGDFYRALCQLAFKRLGQEVFICWELRTQFTMLIEAPNIKARLFDITLLLDHLFWLNCVICYFLDRFGWFRTLWQLSLIAYFRRWGNQIVFVICLVQSDFRHLQQWSVMKLCLLCLHLFSGLLAQEVNFGHIGLSDVGHLGRRLLRIRLFVAAPRMIVLLSFFTRGVVVWWFNWLILTHFNL